LFLFCTAALIVNVDRKRKFGRGAPCGRLRS
jgi:hypothetical protein